MIGVVADDITGAGDIGIMYAKANLETYVYPLQAWEDNKFLINERSPDVLILDTNSRLDTPEEAYNKAFRATKALLEAGCDTFYNKTCSVFRGNIGAEFDAMLDALNRSFALVVLGFPKTGRTTIDGIHYVRGMRLEDSEFSHDPVHPMTQSELVGILQAQTTRKVDHIDISIVDAGSECLRETIAAKKRECHYLIVDVRDQASLRIIAKAAKDETILYGSSALAEEWALLDTVKASTDTADRSAPREDKAMKGRDPVLCVAGSLMPQTKGQTNYLIEKGIHSIELNSLLLIDPLHSDIHLNEVVVEAAQILVSGKDVLIYASNEKEKVAETKQRGLLLGMSNIEVSRIISEAIAEAVNDICRRSNQRPIVVAGGETSAAVCQKLGITGFRIWKEIEFGLPSCESLDSESRLFVLKSGSFGSEDFLWKAIEHLKDEGGLMNRE